MSAGVAIVGAGLIARIHALSARSRGARVVAIASRRPAAALHLGRLFDARAFGFDDLAAMLAMPEVGLVVVASPNALHAAHVTAALDAGKAVLAEKPLALSVAEADALAAHARAAALTYGENHLYAPAVLAARDAVASGAIGRVRTVSANFLHTGPPRGTWFWDPELGGGGAWLDLGVHPVGTLPFLLGAPLGPPSAARFAYEAAGGVEVEAWVEAEAAGVPVALRASWRAPESSCLYRIEGEGGVVEAVIEPQPGGAWITRDGVRAPLPHDAAPGRALGPLVRRGYVAQLADALGRAPRSTVATGRDALAFTLAARDAARS